MTRLVCRLTAVAVLGIVSTLLAPLVFAGAVSAQPQSKKFSGTGKFGPMLSQTMLLPADAPNHQVTLVNRLQTWNSSDPDWNDVQVTQFVFSDYVGGSGYHRGHNVNMHPGGDRTFLSYEGQTTRNTNPDGSWEARFEGKFRLTGGTGKFRGITGEGTYLGKGSAPGGPTATAASFEWQGEYSLPR
jgi:hypothetical protein